MSEQWFCPKCGTIPLAEVGNPGGGSGFHRKCKREVYEEVPPPVAALQSRIAELEKVCEAAAEWFGPSLQDARFETVAVIKALREAGYRGTTQESGQ